MKAHPIISSCTYSYIPCSRLKRALSDLWPYRKPGGGTPHPCTHEIIHMREAALYAWTYCISTFSICKPYLIPAFTGKPHVHMNKHDIRHDCDLQSYCCLKSRIRKWIWMDLRVSALFTEYITKAGQNVWWDQSPSDHFSLLHKHTVEAISLHWN